MYLVGFLILLYHNKFIKFLFIIIFSICIPFLNGCGFQPLYGENERQNLSILESKIDIEKIKGKLFRGNLKFTQRKRLQPVNSMLGKETSKKYEGSKISKYC